MPKRNPVVIITGTSRGLGRALALFYLEKEYKVFGCSRGESTITNHLYNHKLVDVSEENQVRTWVREIKNTNDKIDVLICNAGSVKSTLFMAVTSGDVFEEFVKSNINGTFFIAREVAKLMATQKNGRIIAITSTMVPLRGKGTSVYSSTKSFITQMMKVLAKEMAPLGVTCNMVAPALMSTDSSDKLALDVEWMKRVLELQDIQRVISSEEVCYAVDFLAQPNASAITGQVIYLGIVD